MTPILDPREGDAEDDASSTKKRSLLAIAGSLLAEINLPKLAIAWTMLIILPGLLIGLAPMVATAWFSSLSARLAALAGIGPFVLLGIVAAVGWFGFRPLKRMTETSFWSLNSLVVQPGYALCREGLRHLFRGLSDDDGRAGGRVHAATAAAGGLLAAAIAATLVAIAWQATRWTGTPGDLAHPVTLVAPALANAVVIIGAYLALASAAWGIADATMDQPRDLAGFDDAPPAAARWRVAHLSDIHLVGSEFGFRIESGRAGPRGNGRFDDVLERLEAIHAAEPLDFVLITGDLTDAGMSTEWAAFQEALSRHRALADLTYVLPGNHDVNVVDRANPARLELPGSPGKRLRQMRALSAIEAVQGARVRVVDHDGQRLGATLSETLAPHAPAMRAFADGRALRLSFPMANLWADAFPMIAPPREADGLGLVILNSNAEAHFSFTNALGLVPAEDARAMLAVMREYPRARWIVALHHHLVEYPKPAKAFSERVGTALINGSWFVRQLKPMAGRIAAMHGHRHIDWIGECGALRIVSAPSPLMEATNDQPTAFYVHTFAPSQDGGLALLEPTRVELLPKTDGGSGK